LKDKIALHAFYATFQLTTTITFTDVLQRDDTAVSTFAPTKKYALLRGLQPREIL